MEIQITFKLYPNLANLRSNNEIFNELNQVLHLF